MITKEDVEKLNSFLEQGEKSEVAKGAKTSITTVSNFFKNKREGITTDVQVRIIDAAIVVIDKKNKLKELAKEKINNL